MLAAYTWAGVCRLVSVWNAIQLDRTLNMWLVWWMVMRTTSEDSRCHRMTWIQWQSCFNSSSSLSACSAPWYIWLWFAFNKLWLHGSFVTCLDRYGSWSQTRISNWRGNLPRHSMFTPDYSVNSATVSWTNTSSLSCPKRQPYNETMQYVETTNSQNCCSCEMTFVQYHSQVSTQHCPMHTNHTTERGCVAVVVVTNSVRPIR